METVRRRRIPAVSPTRSATAMDGVLMGGRRRAARHSAPPAVSAFAAFDESGLLEVPSSLDPRLSVGGAGEGDGEGEGRGGGGGGSGGGNGRSRLLAFRQRSNE